jgi:mono/diheme cytochrome c family protein/predicted esterase
VRSRFERTLAQCLGVLVLVCAASPAGADDSHAIAKAGALNGGGEDIYSHICQGCHMPQGQGASGAGHYPKLAGDPALVSWEFVAATVLGGRNGMPSFGLPSDGQADRFAVQLNDQQIADVVNYVRSHFGNNYKDKVTAAQVTKLPHPAAAANVGDDFACTGLPPPVEGVSTLLTRLNGVPAILRAPQVVSKPPIVLWHGFGPPASEADLMKALPLDEVPSVKVYLGLPLFGARAPTGSEESLAQRQAEDYGARIFEPVVLGAAHELPVVVAALRQMKCLGDEDQVSLFGFSAGGAVVLSALIESEVPVRAAVVLNAPVGLNASIEALESATRHPYVWTRRTRDLALRTDAVRHATEIASSSPPPKLLLINGADDALVPPSGSVLLFHALEPLYHEKDSTDRLATLLLPGVTHDWTGSPGLSDVRTQVARWFNSPAG